VQIRKATTETVNLITVAKVIDSKKDTASSTSNGGKQTNQETTRLEDIRQYLATGNPAEIDKALGKKE
jgi:hypothetical protein